MSMTTIALLFFGLGFIAYGIGWSFWRYVWCSEQMQRWLAEQDYWRSRK